MKTIVEKASFINKILGKQEIKLSLKYRRLQFIETHENNGIYLAYNMLTREFVCLTLSEWQILSQDHFFYTESAKDLIENWFAVPIYYDDIKFYQQLLVLYRSFDANDYIDNFTIFTTTDCNARCFYCYEKGIKPIDMSPETANDVAKLIIDHSKGKKVSLHWFGGEPLYNLEVIDLISDHLTKSKIPFNSTMISNGYLFNQTIIGRASKNWNLVQVQITLDGTQDIYNKCKNYIYDDPNPFLRVCDNIDYLLRSNIAVRIRLNMDVHNSEDLFVLCDFIIKHFEGQKKLSVYVALLFDLVNERSVSKKEFLVSQILELENKLSNAGLLRHDLGGVFKNVYCMADNKHSVLINPNGELGKCEHYSNDYIWGTVKEPHYEIRNFDDWQLFADHTEICHTCPYYIECIAPKKCISFENGCDTSDRKLRETRMKRSMYAIFKEKESKTFKNTDNR